MGVDGGAFAGLALILVALWHSPGVLLWLFKGNRDCCIFVPANAGDGGDDVSGLDRVFGYRTVRVSYVKRYRGEDGIEKMSRVRAQIAVSNCGVGRPFR